MYMLQSTPILHILIWFPSFHQDGVGYTVSTLSVTLQYNHDTLTEMQHVKNLVQLCVGVQRACGLQYAAQHALKEGAPLEHAATVGVDSYVAVSKLLAWLHFVLVSNY